MPVYLNMPRILQVALSLALCLLLVPPVSAQTLVVHKNANLREKPTTQSKAKQQLKPEAELTLVDEKRTEGFWHVETETGVRGWVYQTLVHFEDEEEEEDDPVPPPDLEVFDEFDESWPKPKPVGSVLKGPSGGTCPARGETGGDYYTNTRKNRIDIPSSYKPISFDAIFKLPDFWNEDERKHEAPVTRSRRSRSSGTVSGWNIESNLPHLRSFEEPP